MDLFAAAQQTSTARLLAFYQRFQTEEPTLRVNGAKITIENAFNGGHFGSESNHEYRNTKKNVVFGIPADLCPVLQPLDHEIRISTFLEHSLVFLISTTSAVVFGKLEDNYSILH